MVATKILIIGATGYIGGSILSQLLKANLENVTFSALVRGEDKAKVFESKGVKTYLFKSLDELELIQKVAAEHNVVIHAANGYHTTSAKASILGLGDRKKATGQEVHHLQVTGTSDLADLPISKSYVHSPDRIFSDKENIYAYEKSRQATHEYEQRATDLVVVETGLEVGVQTHIIMSPLIYGFGTGLFSRISIQISTLVRSAIKIKQVEVIGEGSGVWDFVHVEDLAALYEIVVKRILAGETVPSGEQGIMFSGSGSFSWLSLSKGLAEALFKLGAIESEEVKSVSVEEAAGKWGTGLPLDGVGMELAFASNSRTSADIAHEFGWKPVKTEEDFQKNFFEEANAILEKQ